MAHFDDSLLLVPTKHSGNYMIYQKNGLAKKRLQYKLNDVIFPFGKESYNENCILNFNVTDSTNTQRNIIFDILKITREFENLKNITNSYNIKDKNFFSFIKKTKCEDNINTYTIRAYLKYGSPITHAKCIGMLPPTYDLKNKSANLTIELGSMWVNKDTEQYGINVYITEVLIVA